MSEFDSNYSGLCCPFCGKNIANTCLPTLTPWIDNLGDEDEDFFFQCQKCQKFFKARLDIYKEYNYNISKPTKEEIKEHGLIPNQDQDITEDCPGQIFMWEDLLLDKS